MLYIYGDQRVFVNQMSTLRVHMFTQFSHEHMNILSYKELPIALTSGHGILHGIPGRESKGERERKKERGSYRVFICGRGGEKAMGMPPCPTIHYVPLLGDEKESPK